MDSKFVFVVNPNGQRSLVSTNAITNIREASPGFDGIPTIICDILGRKNSVVLYAGGDTEDYFDWISDELHVLNYNEHTHGDEEEE